MEELMEYQKKKDDKQTLDKAAMTIQYIIPEIEDNKEE